MINRKFTGWLRACLLLAFAGAMLVSARAALVNGHGYLPLSDWAAANGFKLSRTGLTGEEFMATGRSARVIFKKDSNIVSVNGVNVELSFPVALDKGVVLVSQLDLARTISPLVFAPKIFPKKITTICLDPGHGGKDTGNHVGSHFEKIYTLALAMQLSDQLKKAGFNVILTRTTDEYLYLSQRADIANRRGADLFVCLHFNASIDDADHVQGPETYCITPVGASSSNAQGGGINYGPTPGNRSEEQSLLLAYQVQRSLVKNLKLVDRNVRRARFEVLRDAQMPAILIESGYMTHPAEGRKIFDAGYRQQLAAAIFKGIINYQKLTAPKPAATIPGNIHKLHSSKKP